MQTSNIKFKYMYRDASNYKRYGDAIFTNHRHLSSDEITQQIRPHLRDGKYFIAQQVNLEECFFETLQDDDHAWHEFVHVDYTTLAPFDPENWNQHEHRRDITEFIAELEKANRAGWDETDVRADLLALIEKRKVESKKASDEGKDSLAGEDDDLSQT